MSEAPTNEQHAVSQPAEPTHPTTTAQSAASGAQRLAPKTIEEYQTQVAEQVRTKGEEYARLVPAEWKEGGVMYSKTKKFLKALFVSSGGFSDENVKRLLPAQPRNRSLINYFYITEILNQMVTSAGSEMMEKLFTPEFRLWVGHCISDHDSFVRVAVPYDVSKMRDWFTARAEPHFVYGYWEPVIGDAIQLAPILHYHQSSSDPSDSRGACYQRQKTRLTRLIGHAGQLFWELNKWEFNKMPPRGNDLRDRGAMFTAFSNIWREESMLTPDCEVKWEEWAFIF